MSNGTGHNANKLAASSTSNPENSENLGSGEEDEENNRRSRITTREKDHNLYNETRLAASVLYNQETSSSSAVTVDKSGDQKIWVRSSSSSLNITTSPMKIRENLHLRR